MERLTDGIYTFKGKTEDVENNYILAVQRKLKEYEDLEEQGKLVKLPCAVWDTVYRIQKTSGMVYACTVTGIKQEFNRISVKLHAAITGEACTILVDNWFNLCRMGTDFFLTREEAESALQRMEEPHEKEKEQPE